jgi:2,3-dimethylmalate lyase
VLFVEAPEDEREIEAVAAAFPDTPLVFNSVDGGRTPQLPLERLGELGFRIVLRPVATLFAATRAVQEMLRTGQTPMDFDEFGTVIGTYP